MILHMPTPGSGFRFQSYLLRVLLEVPFSRRVTLSAQGISHTPLCHYLCEQSIYLIFSLADGAVFVKGEIGGAAPYSSLFQLAQAGIQLIVSALLRQQCLVVAALDDLAVF